MNHLKFLFCALLFVGLSTTSCNKDDGGSDRSNYFFCKIDGNDWEAAVVMQPTVNRLTTGSTTTKRLDFFGSDPNGPTISIIVQDYENATTGECLTERTFYGLDHANAGDNFKAATGESNFARLTVTGAGTSSKDGLVRITDCGDGKISGTFEFVVTDLAGTVVHTITDGKLENVAYDFSE